MIASVFHRSVDQSVLDDLKEKAKLHGWSVYSCNYTTRVELKTESPFDRVQLIGFNKDNREPDEPDPFLCIDAAIDEGTVKFVVYLTTFRGARPHRTPLGRCISQSLAAHLALDYMGGTLRP